MTEQQIGDAINAVANDLRKMVPYTPPGTKGKRASTGNMRYNAYKIESIGPNEWRVSVDEAIAPYVPFTNEPWTDAKWKGKANPNEGWWDRLCAVFLDRLAAELNGEKKND